MSIGSIAFVVETSEWRTSNGRIEASIAWQCGVDTTSSRDHTGTAVTWAGGKTGNRWELATKTWYTRSSVANIRSSASNWREITSSGGNAKILSTQVAVAARNGGISATRSSNSNSTRTSLAKVSIGTGGWADTSSLA